MLDIRRWLKRLDLERYADAFEENDIDARSLVMLTVDDLKEMGVSAIGHRRLLLDAISKLSEQEQQPRSQVAEMRQLTVSFCDLVGSTKLALRLDPEDMRNLMLAYQQMVDKIVRQLDGRVAKYMGDGILLYFGYPHAHEDSPERAVRAAMDINAQMSALGALYGEDLQVRTGIDTGLVVVGDLIGEGSSREENVVGRTPNLAARLQSLAAPGEILISGQTRRLTGNVFSYDERGEVVLRGFEGTPTDIFSVVGFGPYQTRFEARAVETGGFVGRERELAELQAAWEAVKGRVGRAVQITGEAGLGKSRLIHAFRDSVAGEASDVAILQCAPHSANTELYPVVTHLRREAEMGTGAPTGRQFQRLRDFLSGFSSLDETDIFSILSLIDERHEETNAGFVDARRRRLITLDALVTFFSGTGRGGPAILIVEDAHWLDPTTRDLLERLVKGIDNLPILMLVTCRPEAVLFPDAVPGVVRQFLRPLDGSQSIEIVQRIAAQTNVSDEVTEQIVARAGGNPLFVEELTKSLLDVETGNGPEPRHVNAETIPASLRDVLTARLDRLGAARGVALTAAAIGREFSGALLAVAMSRPVDEIDAALRDLVEANIVEAADGDSGSAYTFRHALYREAAYESFLRSHRKKVHADIAAALEITDPSIRELQPELLAYHLTEADDVLPALDCWVRAARRSYDRSASAEAIHHTTNALKLLPRRDPGPERDRLELVLQTELGSSLMTLEGFAVPEAHAAFARAYELSHHVKEGVALSRVLRGLVWFYGSQAQLRKSHDVASTLLNLAERSNDRSLIIVGCQSLGIMQFMLGDLLEANKNFEKGLELYEPGRDRKLGFQYAVDPGINSLSLDAIVLWLLGRPETAQTRVAAAIEALVHVEHPLTIALTQSWLARMQPLMRATGPAKDWAEKTIAFAREQDIKLCEAEGMIVRGWSRSIADRAADGIVELSDGVELWRSTGSRVFEPYYLYLLADATSALGELEAACDILREALEMVENNDERWLSAEIRRFWADTLRKTGGETSDIERLYLEAIADARGRGARSLELRAAMSFCAFLESQGRVETGRGYVRHAYSGFTEGFATPELMEAAKIVSEDPEKPVTEVTI